MPIHTVPIDKDQYIRIISLNDAYVDRRVGEVGKVESFADLDEDGAFVFVEMTSRVLVFYRTDIEYITEKEYFKGCLRG